MESPETVVVPSPVASRASGWDELKVIATELCKNIKSRNDHVSFIFIFFRILLTTINYQLTERIKTVTQKILSEDSKITSKNLEVKTVNLYIDQLISIYRFS